MVNKLKPRNFNLNVTTRGKLQNPGFEADCTSLILSSIVACNMIWRALFFPLSLPMKHVLPNSAKF